jgi:cell division septation protein DedD
MSDTPIARGMFAEDRARRAADEEGGNAMNRPPLRARPIEVRTEERENERAAPLAVERPLPNPREQTATPMPQPPNPTGGVINLTA